MSHIRTVTISYEEYQELKEGNKHEQWFDTASLLYCRVTKKAKEYYDKVELLEKENARLRNHWLVRLLIKDKK